MASGPPSTIHKQGGLALVIDAMEAGSQFAKTRMNFMKIIKYRWWMISLMLIIMWAPAEQLCATIKQFTDEKGIIHIINIGKDKAKLQNEDYTASVHHKSDVVNPNGPTPSNIFPEPEEANALASNQNFQATAPEP
jgi:hypothetical protein